jgi:predicted metal-binding membrane protein
MKRIAILTALILAAVSAFGQAVRIDIPLQTSGPNVPISGGPLPQALWVANAAAYLCTHPSATLVACQAHLITTYTDSTEGTTCPTATPLVQLPGNTCTAATGTTANVGFWYGGGVFDYWIVSSYGTYGPFSGNSGGVGSGCGVSGACTIAQGGTGATTAAGGYKEGGVPGAIAGGLTGIVAPELVASPEGQIALARTLYKMNGLTPLVGAGLQADRKKETK